MLLMGSEPSKTPFSISTGMPNGSVVATDPVSVDADYDNGAVALYGSARCGTLYKDEARRLIRARREAEEERAARFRELYAMLGLQVACHGDRSLEVTWGGGQTTLHCPNLNLRGRGPTQVGTTQGVSFQAMISLDGETDVEVTF
jgi:hypothetical protein